MLFANLKYFCLNKTTTTTTTTTTEAPTTCPDFPEICPYDLTDFECPCLDIRSLIKTNYRN